MALMSDQLENGLVNHVFRGVTFKSPDSIWVGLFTADPTDTSASFELTGKGYKRVLVEFDSPQNGIVKNSKDIIFHYATSKWPEVTHLVLFDAEKGGSTEIHGKLKSPVTVSMYKNFVIKSHRLHVGFE